MVHNNKVLTVSYGTFSCTLEGFDDSFGTMKAIAEYFRDLASDDRYFGAEPPQPDAEMLARIAQREITRQVEAHSTDTGGIVLRAAEPAPIPDIAPPVEDAPEEQAPVEVAPVVSPLAAVEPTPEPTIEPDLPVEEAAEAQIETVEIAETTEDEVAVEEISAISPEPAVTPEPVEHIPEAEIRDEIEVEIEVVAEVEGTTEVEVEAEVEVEVTDVIEVEAGVEDLAEVDAGAETEAATADAAETVIVPEPEPAADSIAAKLQRIRAVVSQNDSFVQSDDYAEDQDDYTEDQHADGFVDAAAQGISQALETDEEIDEEVHESVEEQDADNEILQTLSQLDVHDEADNERHDTGDQSNDEAETPSDEDMIADTLETQSESLENQAAQDDDSDIGDQAEEPDPVRAKVVKVKRADLEAAIATGQMEQIEAPEDDDIFADHAAPQDSSLSPEDEADLMRELSAVEDELMVGDADNAGPDDNIFGDDIASEVADEHDHEEIAGTLQKSVSEDGDDLSRLMAEADEKLEDPETSSRHETYSQLRAAVAAAEAERSAGGSVGGPESDDAYRDDLAGVVRPRRPSRDGTRASRPVADARPAPLKLVAEQRVDDGTSIAERGPVRPRRVMTVPVSEASAPDTTAADSAFADFATRVGATELPELLEAAAAYLFFVEGYDKFSRPQLMGKVRLVKQDDFNREDGLRSFGQLLRDGKIKKKGGGRFAAAGDIGFRPDEREAG